MAFAWMIARAAWQPVRVRYKGQAVALGRGELCISQRDMANAFDRDKAWIERLWKRLISEAMIEARREAAATVITICNYDKYQAFDDKREAEGEARATTNLRQARGSGEAQNNEENKGMKEDTPNGVLFGEDAEPAKADDEKLSVDDVVSAWNANIATRYGLPRCTRLSDSRKAQIRARLREYSFEEMDGVFRAFGRSRFLQGEPSRDGRRMRADIGWVMNPTNFIKIMEGKYDD